jgi:putative SOS response-associated peptidase YedK
MPKRPYFARAKRGADGAAPPLAFAGLWETWTGPNGEEVDTAAIITTTANRTLAAIHGRMPVFVASEAFDLWLDCANVEAEVAAALIAPAPDGLLEVHEVSNAVNRVVNDSAALIAPAAATAEAVATAAQETKAKPKKAKASDDQASLF